MTEHEDLVKVKRNMNDALMLACAFGRNSRCHKVISQAIIENEIELPEIKEDRRYLDELSLETELYARKAFALLARSELSLNIVAEGWPGIYKALEKHSLKSPNKPYHFMNEGIRGFVDSRGGIDRCTDEEVNDAGLMIILMADAFDVQLTGDDDFRRVLGVLYVNRDNVPDPTKSAKNIAKGLAKIRRLVDIPNSYHFDFLFDRELFGRDAMLYGIKYYKDDVANVLTSMEIIQPELLCSEHLQELVYDGLIILYLLRAYRKAKNDFFAYVKQVEFDEKARRDAIVARTNELTVSKKLKDAEATIAELQAENEKLKKQIADAPRIADEDRKELIELRNALFEAASEYVAPDDDTDDLLADANFVFVGGHETLRKKIKELYPHCSTVGTENYPVDITRNADVVFFHPAMSSHALYYRVLANAERDNVHIVTNNNIELLISQMNAKLR